MDTSSIVSGFAELTHYLGFDWATDKHDVVVVGRTGQIVLQLTFENTAEGWATLRQKLLALGAPRTLGVAIETSHGPAVERLWEMGLQVFPINPKAAERYRDRKAPSGVKDDQLDAWSFADALRTDGQDWRPLRPEDPQTQLLRLLARDEIALIEQRTALILQLQAALYEYYPAALEAFDDWGTPATWEFVARFPTPTALLQAGPRRWQKFLHLHHMGKPETFQKRMAIFARADKFVNPSTAVTQAKSMLALAVVRQLQTLEAQLRAYRQRIEQLFNDHPDHDLFGSLPGAAAKLAPRLLAEIGTNRQVFDSAEALQCYAGTAPVTRRSGKHCSASFRRACNRTLRATVHLWADLSRKDCAWAQAYYLHKKEQGKGHAQALRCLGQRWLKILWRMWQEHQPYDEARHLLNQTSHGSWVIGLIPTSNPETPVNGR